ncbi:alpha/beta hydrolase [Microvirga sp. W0021]|uniref:Alpha/beta hydrolase n=1 Tax=Hohaiivirga grylli TaxID=3133970 RepID=A0ABV0BH37_9HYPH
MKNRPAIYLLALAFSIFNLTALTAQERNIPERILPVPETVSSELKAMIAAGSAPFWNDHPASAQEWKAWVNELASQVIKELPALREAMKVKVTQATIADVKVFIVTPDEIAPENANRVLLHFHGGGYVLNPGEAATSEAIMVAGHSRIKVISVDYRMPPDFPYPAAMDDALAVYRQLVTQNEPARIGVFGTSTGGGMALALIHRIKTEGLLLPGAVAAGTPWSDLTKTGDSYYSNDTVDNVLVRYEGWLGDAAKLYANGHDLKDPQLSPVYGDFSVFPPTILVSGTRDLFLSNTVRVHRKLRNANISSDLIVFEGMSHAQYLFDANMPEAKEFLTEVDGFFNRHLKK